MSALSSMTITRGAMVLFSGLRGNYLVVIPSSRPCREGGRPGTRGNRIGYPIASETAEQRIYYDYIILLSAINVHSKIVSLIGAELLWSTCGYDCHPRTVHAVHRVGAGNHRTGAPHHPQTADVSRSPYALCGTTLHNAGYAVKPGPPTRTQAAFWLRAHVALRNCRHCYHDGRWQRAQLRLSLVLGVPQSSSQPLSLRIFSERLLYPPDTLRVPGL